MICKVCQGMGWLKTASKPCPRCGGTGTADDMQDIPEVREITQGEWNERAKSRKFV